MSMSTELYKHYRPTRLEEVLGNTSTVASLTNMLERGTLPHTLLFYGPSGCGKTTLARILRQELNCSDMDFRELNCSDFRGIDTIREISRSMNLAPTGGPCRVWLLDEVHQMSKDGQNAALKILEDTPSHVYFILCTTDPQKILKTIRTRCCELPVESLSRQDMASLLKGVAKREKKAGLDKRLIEDIIDAAEGSARTALVLLDKVLNLEEADQQRGAVVSLKEDTETIELCRALLKREGWTSVSKLLREIQADPESVRWAVLGYARAVLLKKKDTQAYQAYHVITCFEDPFYDSKAAGLARACFEAVCDDING
jgi:DNA polymerase III gamma/tau subunit